MRKSRFSDDQIFGVLKEHAAGIAVADICRKHGISNATFYTWCARFGGLEVADTKKLRALEEENRKLKKLAGRVTPECGHGCVRWRTSTVNSATDGFTSCSGGRA